MVTGQSKTRFWMALAGHAMPWSLRLKIIGKAVVLSAAGNDVDAIATVDERFEGAAGGCGR